MNPPTHAVPLARRRTREVGEVLARAFHDEPGWSWLLPCESRRAQVMPWFMRVWTQHCRKHGEVYTTSGKVEGAALWVSPGKYSGNVLRMMLSGLMLVPLKFGWTAFGRVMASLNHYERLHKLHVPPRHWYLSVLGVDPPRQGRGIGSALLRPVLARADAEGLSCYLETETEKNVLFYRGHGFEIAAEDDLPDGGPHFWAMVRKPRPALGR